MPKNQKKRPSDVNKLAHQLVKESTQIRDEVDAPTKEQISLLMSQMGRRGGKIGGKRRLQTMSSVERKQVATAAARARWAKHPRKESQDS